MRTAKTIGQILPSLLLVLLLAAPRVARLLSPQVWVESEAYLNCGFLVSLGMKPYVDFPLCHPPGAEGILALLFLIFGASIRTTEIFTQMLVWISSLLLYALGNRLHGRVTGIAAGLIYSLSYVLFRYHMFEREIYLAVPVLTASWLALDLAANKNPKGKSTAIALLMCLAFTFKLTTLAHTIGILVFLALSGYGLGKTFRLLLVTIALVTVVFLGFYLSYGRNFLIHVFLFQFLVHASPSLGPKLQAFATVLDINLSLAFTGLLIALLRRQWKNWALPLIQLLFSFIFVVLINATFWPHNAIELLPWLSLLGGYFIHSLFEWSKLIVSGRSESYREPAFALVSSTVVFGLLAIFLFPVQIAGWGFGYESRKELADLSAYVKKNTSSKDEIFVPSIIALEANRQEVVTFPEIAGTMLELETLVGRKGWWTALSASQIDRRNFGANVVYSRRFWLPGVIEAIKRRRIAVVINPKPRTIGPIAPVTIQESLLLNQGYTQTYSTQNYSVWLRGR